MYLSVTQAYIFQHRKFYVLYITSTLAIMFFEQLNRKCKVSKLWDANFKIQPSEIFCLRELFLLPLLLPFPFLPSYKMGLKHQKTIAVSTYHLLCVSWVFYFYSFNVCTYFSAGTIFNSFFTYEKKVQRGVTFQGHNVNGITGIWTQALWFQNSYS